MQTVAQTEAFLAKAARIGMTNVEVEAAVLQIAENPTGGDVIRGSGGCRKVRVAREGGGKSGGYRVITLYGHDRMPVYLLTVLSKTQAANFTPEQVKAMHAAAKQIIANWRRSPEELE